MSVCSVVLRHTLPLFIYVRPSDVWFGVGFNAALMADLPYAITVAPSSGNSQGIYDDVDVAAGDVHVHDDVGDDDDDDDGVDDDDDDGVSAEFEVM